MTKEEILNEIQNLAGDCWDSIDRTENKYSHQGGYEPFAEAIYFLGMMDGLDKAEKLVEELS